MTLAPATELEPYPNGKKLFYAFSKARTPSRRDAEIDLDWRAWELGFADKHEWEQAAINFVNKG